MDKADWGEYDQRLDFLTDSAGRLALKTRGSKHLKSKLAPWLQLFSINQLLVVPARRGTLDLLIGVEPVFQWSRLYQEEKRLKTAFYLAELIEKSTWSLPPWWAVPDQPQIAYPFFTLLKNGLNWLEQATENSINKRLELFLCLFELKILDLLGFGFDPATCPVCAEKIKKDNFAFFDQQSGGILCANCGRTRRAARLIPFSVVLAFQKLISAGRGEPGDFQDMAQSTQNLLRQLIPDFLEYNLEQKIHSRNQLISWLAG